MWWWWWAGHCFIRSCLFLIHIFLHMSGGKGVSVRISSLFACVQMYQLIHGVAADEQEILFIFSPDGMMDVFRNEQEKKKKQGGSLSSELMLDADSQKYCSHEVCCKKEADMICICFLKKEKFLFCFLVFDFFQVDAALFCVLHILCCILKYCFSWKQGNFEGQLPRKYVFFFTV